MQKKIVVVNAGPRKGWNTDTLITEASRGAESAGAVVERFDLFRLEKYTGYKQVFDTFVGPTEVLVSGETLQLRDYSATDWPWTLFDPALKQARHEKVFPEECRKAYELGAGLVQR